MYFILKQIPTVDFHDIPVCGMLYENRMKQSWSLGFLEKHQTALSEVPESNIIVRFSS